jgi:hypothetical protein
MINATFTYLRPIALFLIVAILFHNCKAYYRKPVAVEEAVRPDKKRVKIITIDNRKLIFDSIYYKNDTLCGLLRKNKTIKQKTEVNIPIHAIKSIHLLNKPKSVILTVVLIGSLSIVFAAILTAEVDESALFFFAPWTLLRFGPP